MDKLFQLPHWQQALIATGFTWLMTALGAFFVFFIKKVRSNTFSLLMSLAAGIMLASTYFSLLAPAVEQLTSTDWYSLPCGFSIGCLFIVLTDLFVSAIERKQQDPSKQKCSILCFAITMHNIPEGLAVGIAFGAVSDYREFIAACMLALGIGLQNFPEGMCVSFPLRANGFTRFRSFLLGQFSGAVEIIAGVLGVFSVNLGHYILPWALSLSSGAMIAVICSELIPDSFSSNKIRATIGISLGFAIMMTLDVLFA